MSFEWPSRQKGGVVRYTYPEDKRPDTSGDMLSLGFITPSFDAVLARVEGHPSEGSSSGSSSAGSNGSSGSSGSDKKDFLELQIVSANQ